LKKNGRGGKKVGAYCILDKRKEKSKWTSVSI